MPIGLVVNALPTPIFTRLAQHLAPEDLCAYGLLVVLGTRKVLILVTPFVVWLLVLGGPTGRLIYQHGAFNPESTLKTASGLTVLAAGLLPSAVAFFWQSFFARQDSRRPMQYSLTAITVNILGDLLLVHPLKLIGLALATVLASWVTAVLLGWKTLLLAGDEGYDRAILPRGSEDRSLV